MFPILLSFWNQPESKHHHNAALDKPQMLTHLMLRTTGASENKNSNNVLVVPN